MSTSEWIPLAVAGLGIAGTLAGTVVGGKLNERGQRSQWHRDDLVALRDRAAATLAAAEDVIGCARTRWIYRLPGVREETHAVALAEASARLNQAVQAMMLDPAPIRIVARELLSNRDTLRQSMDLDNNHHSADEDFAAAMEILQDGVLDFRLTVRAYLELPDV